MQILPKTLRNRFILAVVLMIVGWIANYILVRMLLNNQLSYNSGFDSSFNLVIKLLAANFLILPAVFMLCAGISMAAKLKKFGWLTVGIAGLIASALIIIYFSTPVISPGVGL